MENEAVISRRNFLIKAAATVLGIAAPSLLGCGIEVKVNTGGQVDAKASNETGKDFASNEDWACGVKEEVVNQVVEGQTKEIIRSSDKLWIHGKIIDQEACSKNDKSPDALSCVYRVYPKTACTQ